MGKGGGGKKSKVPALGVTTPFMNAYSTTACHGNLHPDNLYGTQVIIEHFPRSVGSCVMVFSSVEGWKDA